MQGQVDKIKKKIKKTPANWNPPSSLYQFSNSPFLKNSIFKKRWSQTSRIKRPVTIFQLFTVNKFAEEPDVVALLTLVRTVVDTLLFVLPVVFVCCVGPPVAGSAGAGVSLHSFTVQLVMRQ